jgi:hypothetical protein
MDVECHQRSSLTPVVATADGVLDPALLACSESCLPSGILHNKSKNMLNLLAAISGACPKGKLQCAVR